MSQTNDDLMQAAQGEAFARLKYMAFAYQAMEEGMPKIAQLFAEAAGAETIHGITHLKAAGFVKSTIENLRSAVEGEQDEVDEMYPQMIARAEEEAAPNKDEAVNAYRVAMEREAVHNKMFSDALAELTQ